MKILFSQDIYNADRATLKNQKITSVELMERAPIKCFEWIINKFQYSSSKIIIFCGVGNNGGDGLVIARHLIENGYKVICYVVNFSNNWSEEFDINYNRLLKSGESPKLIQQSADFPEIGKDAIVVDAIFGIGLKRAVEGFAAKLILHINKSKNYIIAIDIPSGLFVDRANLKKAAIIEASHILTFQQPKLAFLLPDNQKYITTWEVLNIGLDSEYINSVSGLYSTIEKDYIQSIYKRRTKFSHKGSYGRALMIGGSFGKIGAIALASKAALKSGSGLVTAYVPKSGYQILQVSIPEVMVEVDAEKELHFFNYKTKPTVIGIGPGMGTSEKTLRGFTKLLEENTVPLVLDADALNLLARTKKLLKWLPKNSVLTPHPKELERLIGVWENDYEKLERLKKFCSDYTIILVLKGANTVITDGERFYFNTTGNPALATPGSGDVLTGIITGLLAQHYRPIDAAILGVYLHGLSADIGLKTESIESFTASNILKYLGSAFKSVSIS